MLDLDGAINCGKDSAIGYGPDHELQEDQAEGVKTIIITDEMLDAMENPSHWQIQMRQQMQL